MKVAILGTGAYGIALSSLFYENNNKVFMWTKFEDEKNTLIKERKSLKLKEYIIPNDIVISNDLKYVVNNANLIVIAVPTAFVNSTSLMLKEYYNKSQVICIASKGIEQDTCRFLFDVIKQNINTKKIGIISGPSFAVDVIKKVPIALTLASKNKDACSVIKKGLKNDHFKLRETTDIIGIEVCGSIKNIIAIASGIVDGLGMPISTKAFLITESLHDIKELIKALGGNKKTILSFAGFGDILLTCTSDKSRNYSFGKLIGSGLDKAEISEYLKTTTVEGVYTLKSIYKLIKRKKIKIPIIDLIYKIVFLNSKPDELLKFLVKK